MACKGPAGKAAGFPAGAGLNHNSPGFNSSEKYESQWVKDDIPYLKWKIIQPCLKPPTRLGTMVASYSSYRLMGWIIIVTPIVPTLW